MSSEYSPEQASVTVEMTLNQTHHTRLGWISKQLAEEAGRVGRLKSMGFAIWIHPTGSVEPLLGVGWL